MARPSDYSPELAAQICAELASGLSLRDTCKLPDMPSERSVYRWLAASEEFRQAYARACEQRVEVFSEDIITIGNEASGATYIDMEGNTRVDTGAIQAARLKTDNLKWIMARMAPKKWGDRVEHVIHPGSPDQLTDAELARIAAPALLLEHNKDGTTNDES